MGSVPSLRSASWLVMASVLVATAAGAETADDVLRFVEAAFVLDAGPAPPPDADPRWTTVSLPDRWVERRPDAGGHAWYRFAVRGPYPPHARLALSLAGVNMNAEAFVNGIPVGSGGRMHEPVTRNSNRPLYWTFAGSLLDRELNHVDVRLFAYANDVGSLGAVALGSDEALRPEFMRRHFLQIELVQVTTGLVLLLTVFFGALYLGAGREPLHGWYALSTGAWAFVSLNFWLQDPGVGHWTWVRVFYLALGTFAMTLPIWAHQLLGLERRVLDRILVATLGAYALMAVALPDPLYRLVVSPFQAAFLAGGLYGVYVLVSRWRAYSRLEAFAYVSAGLFCTSFALADLLDAWGLGMGWHPYFMPYIGSALAICLATTLGVRFATSLEDARRAARDLEQRVRAKTIELESNHARLRELERDQVLAEERRRIVREMHDGIGGQLVATLAMVQAGEGEPREIANALRDALDDMRSVIDSMDPLVDDLGKLLGSLRGRFEALLRRQQLRFVWRVGDLPATPWLGPEQYLHILRILQEALANAVRHAAPSEIEVSVVAEDSPEPALRISVCDDGRKAAAAASTGRGIGHMRGRARALGGELRIRPRDPGTCVELWLPIPKDGEEGGPRDG